MRPAQRDEQVMRPKRRTSEVQITFHPSPLMCGQVQAFTHGFLRRLGVQADCAASLAGFTADQAGSAASASTELTLHLLLSPYGRFRLDISPLPGVDRPSPTSASTPGLPAGLTITRFRRLGDWRVKVTGRLILTPVTGDNDHD